MNANDMFKKLGFLKKNAPLFEDTIVYGKGDIIFDLTYKAVNTYVPITKELEKAIKKKKKELRW